MNKRPRNKFFALFMGRIPVLLFATLQHFYSKLIPINSNPNRQKGFQGAIVFS